jgi:hypothetical protein
VPLAPIAIGLTLRATPDLPPDPEASGDIDLAGTGRASGRRSRWVYATQGRYAAITKRPPPL